MPTYEIELPDGRAFEVDAPDEAALTLTVKSLMGTPKPSAPSTPSEVVAAIPGNSAPTGSGREAPSLVDRAIGAGEAALSTVTGATSGAVGQVGGFLGGLAGAVRTGEFGTDEGARRVEQTTTNAASRLTYAPRTDQGRRQAAAVGEAINATVPLMPIAGEIAATAGNAGRAVSAVVSPQVRRAAAAIPARVRRAQAQARSEPSPLNPQVRVDPAVAAAERAQKYAVDRLGTPLSDLPAAIQSDLKAVARDATALERLDPEAVRRQANLQSLPVPVPATRGQLTRDLAQITREESIRKSDAGAPLMDIMAQQDSALGQNLAGMRGRARATTPQQFGNSVQGATRGKLGVLERKTNALYDRARESGAMAAPVEVGLLDEWLTVPANQRNVGWLKGALDTYRDGPNGRVTINDLELIRQEATAAAAEPGRTGYYARQAVGVIDDILDTAANATDAGSPYRAARASYRAMKQEFTQQRLVDRLTNNVKNSRDRKVALEETIGEVLGSSSEQIAALRHTLLTGGTAETRRAGLQAWRDVRGGVIDHLRNQARNSEGAGTANTAGTPQFNGGKFLKAFDTLDADGVLAEMFSSKELARLRSLREAVHDVRTTPSGRVSGSDTTPRLLNAIEAMRHAPIGNIGRGAASKAADMYREGMKAKETVQATTSPLQEAARAPPPKPRRPTLRDYFNASPPPSP